MEVADIMWTPLQKTGYFIKFIKQKEDLYYIGVTDYKNYWISLTSSKRFLCDLKNSNEGTDFEDEAELLKRGFDMLQNPASLKKVSILQEENGALLAVSMTKFYEFSLKLELGLIEASGDHFFKMIVQPLLRTVCDLRSSQYELRELLKKKDREIDDWRTDGRVPRRNKTNVYDDERHMKKHIVFEQNFGAEVPELLKALGSTDIPECKFFRKANPKSEKMAQLILENNTNISTESRENSENNLLEHVKIEKNSQNTAAVPNMSQNVVSPKTEKLSQSLLIEDIQQSRIKDATTNVEECRQSAPTYTNTNRNIVVTPKIEVSSQSLAEAMATEQQSRIENTTEDIGQSTQSLTYLKTTRTILVSPKIEKSSQSALLDKMPTAEPMQDATITNPMVESHKNNVKTEYTGPLKKRPKNKLNY